VKELPPHDGPVTTIEFHPTEFLVATGSADRTVKFWDLESFDQIDSLGPEATVGRCRLNLA
jgi:katanin p80 WD40 repeat-containing subunit B1